jgi:hypothetical protein
VLASDAARGRLLLADAGRSFEGLGNPPALWLRLLPRSAELQRDTDVPASVPDRTLPRRPGLYDGLARSELPLEAAEVEQLRRFAPRFAELCDELSGFGLAAAIQHDDLRHRNTFVDGERLRIVDWGDASRSHPFVSLVVAFRFLEEHNGLRQDDPWFARLRDAYLEPWDSGLSAAFELAERLGRSRTRSAGSRCGASRRKGAAGLRRAVPRRAPSGARRGVGRGRPPLVTGRADMDSPAG